MRIINKLKIFLSKKDYCVICHKITPYDKNIHIDKRKYYIECAGQLCKSCYFNLYG